MSGAGGAGVAWGRALWVLLTRVAVAAAALRCATVPVAVEPVPVPSGATAYDSSRLPTCPRPTENASALRHMFLHSPTSSRPTHIAAPPLAANHAVSCTLNPYCPPSVTGTGCVLVCLGFFVAACRSDPGTVRREDLAAWAALYPLDGVVFPAKHCATCDMERPARSKHCGVCGR